MRFPSSFIAALAIMLAAASLPAQESAGHGRFGRSGERGSGGGRGAGVESTRARRGRIQDRAEGRAPGDRGPGEDRGNASERRRERDAAMAPEDRAMLADRMRGRVGGLRGAPTPDQQAFVQALRDKRRDLRAAVAAGTLDRHAAAEELRAWLRSNPPVGASNP